MAERLIRTGPGDPASPALLLEELPTASGHWLGLATLNAERTLNALSLPMIDILGPALASWGSRPEVVAVLVQGAGDRHFCAGGDLQALYQAMRRNAQAPGPVDDQCARFFELEYRLDYALRCFPKPVLALGHGAVMGGGLGIFSAARFRLVTHRSRLAMPEVSIGLFPDAGASWTLKTLPTACALFLAATGSAVGAGDALHLGLATHAVDPGGWAALLQALQALPWAGDASDEQRIATCLATHAVGTEPGPLARNEAALRAALATPPTNGPALAAAIRALAGVDPWVDQGILAMERGCPTTIGIVAEQVRRMATLGLADCFRLELVVATNCARNGEFQEGIRALLIDKDNAPRWRYGHVDAVPRAHVLAHFEPPWPRNPLHDLEAAP